MPLTVTFVKDAESLTLPAPQSETPHAARRMQSTGLSAGGTRYVYDADVALSRRTLSFAALTGTQAAALETFFHNRRAQQETFVYTDSSGDTHDARFAGDTLVLRQHAADCWDAEVEVETDKIFEP